MDLVIFTYALAGLGHLRVTSALYSGLPQGIESLSLGSHDEAIKDIHRVTSTHPTIRRVVEWMIGGPLSFFFTGIYKNYLRSRTGNLHNQITTLLEARLRRPKSILFVCTHFSLAHQLAALKERLEKEKELQVKIVVQVTDDFAHPMWYVEGADLLVVPSRVTKEKFETIRRNLFLPYVEIKVLPYPVSPILARPLSPQDALNKLEQFVWDKKNLVHFAFPVSGAAVNLAYYNDLINNLVLLSERYFFHVVSREAPYTIEFLNSMAKAGRVDLHTSKKDQEVVDYFEEVFMTTVVGFEITKPSEEAFKALLDTSSRGGAILLLTEPFGPQEESNLEFLERHYLIPKREVQETLWQMGEVDNSLRVEACGWRGIRLPSEPRHAAEFIKWCHEKGIFSQMLLCHGDPKEIDPDSNEVAKNGVEQFWKVVGEL